MDMRVVVWIIIVCSFFTLGAGVFAHNLGQSLEKQAGEYIIDIGYDSLTSLLVSGEAIRFDFNLWNKDRTEFADFTSVWVRVAPVESGITFAGYLGFPEFGALGMSYAFPKPGNYTFTARFFNGEETLAEASFPLSVTGGMEERAGASYQWAIAGIAGIILGFMLSFIFRRR